MAKTKRQRFAYKHTLTAALLIALFVVAFDSAPVQGVLEYAEGLGLLGVFFGGILVTSFFTAGPGVALLLALSQDYNPLVVGAIGGLGSLIGDWVILRIFEDKVGDELKPLVQKIGLGAVYRRLRRKKERQRALVLGMAVILTPLPDEFGIALLGLSKFPLTQLLIIIYILNALGLIVLASAVQL